ncbi:MAG: hypothetical protein IJS03_01255 [Eubacterium sp.]|nr:hypothetical protein [Eubacterium sp.]
MTFKKICKIIAVIAALCALAAAAYYAVKKLTDKDEPEYFDDNDFFECDNDLEIVEVEDEPEEPKEEKKKAAPKKKAAKKDAE